MMTTGESVAGEIHRPDHPLILAERVKGTHVYESGGDRIGKLEDVAIDKVSGAIAYAIIGFGGFLGLGERLHPIPWGILSYSKERNGYVIPVDRKTLETAPTINADELSGWGDAAQLGEVFDHYGRYSHPL